ncbi:MAG: right-handed parallel beta-helix repeat-containing protein, partial [Planctomycetota bacterium]
QLAACALSATAFAAAAVAGGQSVAAAAAIADDVEADADGVAGPIVGLHAIQLAPDVERVRIRNGGMTGWSGSAVHSDGRNGSCVLEDLQIDEAGDLELFPSVMLGDDARVRDVTISGGPGAGLVADGGVFDRVVVHGCEGDGFVINDGAVLRGCHAEGNAAGIIVGGSGVLDSCGAHDNRGSGIVGGVGMTVSDCGASGNGGTGIRVLTGSTLTGCNAEGNSSDGISVGSGSTVIGCNARNNEVHGIVTGDDAQVRHCNADSNRIHGIVTGARCHITDNHASNSGRGSDQGRSGIGNWPTGIRALGTDCVIERNLTTRNRYGWVGEGGAGFTQIVINNKSIRDVRGCGAYTGAGSTTGAQLTQTGLIQTFSPYVNFCLKAGEPDP